MEDTSTSIKRIQLRHIALIIMIVIVFAAYGFAAITLFNSVARTAAVSPVAQTVQQATPAAPITEVAPVVAQETTIAPVETTPVAAPATSSPSNTSALSGYIGKYAAEMTAAGILDSDKPLVASLMLSGDQWVVQGSPTMHEISTTQDPTLRISKAKFYVIERWATWQGAVDFAAAHNGNW